MAEMDLALVVLTCVGIVAAVGLSVVVGTLAARLFFHATRGDPRDAD